MITITRSLVKQLRSVLRRALCLTGNGLQLRVELTAGAGGLSIRCTSKGSAAEYHLSDKLPDAQMVIPFGLLRQVEGSRPDPVTFTHAIDSEVTVSWQEGDIPRTSTVVVPESLPDEPEFPATPNAWAENSSELRRALHAAMETAEDTSTRYALASIQLRGAVGSLVATDGRQALIQSGYQFPFDDDVLVSRTLVFDSKELPTDAAVYVGRSENHVAFRIGPWTFYREVTTGARFPDVESIVPRTEDALAAMALHEADRQWLAENIRGLPGGNQGIVPVTVELNGSVAVRSRNGDARTVTELVLANSRREGQEIAVATDRRFLARALHLGFSRMHIFGRDKPVLCPDERKTLFWAVLDPAGLVPACGNVIRVCSPTAGQVGSADAKDKKRVVRRTRTPRTHKTRARIQHNGPASSTTPRPLGGPTKPVLQ